MHLEDHTLDLLQLAQVNVANQDDPDEGQSHNTHTSRQHARLGIAVRMLDSQTRLAANRVAQLGIDILVNHGEVGHRLLGEVPLQGIGEGVCPDGARDGSAQGITDGTHDIQQGQGGGDVLVVHGGEDGDLLHDDEDGTADGDEDLAHDLVSDGLVRATEVDHETLGKDVQRDGDPQEPLESSGATHQVTNQQEQHARNDAERVRDVSGLGDAQVVDNLQVRGEVVGPAVVGDLVRGIEQAGADQGAVLDERPVEQGHGGKEFLVDAEEDQHEAAHHDHGDDVARGPTLGCRRGDIEGNEEDDETDGENEHAEGYDSVRVSQSVTGEDYHRFGEVQSNVPSN